MANTDFIPIEALKKDPKLAKGYFFGPHRKQVYRIPEFVHFPTLMEGNDIIIPEFWLSRDVGFVGAPGFMDCPECKFPFDSPPTLAEMQYALSQGFELSDDLFRYNTYRDFSTTSIGSSLSKEALNFFTSTFLVDNKQLAERPEVYWKDFRSSPCIQPHNYEWIGSNYERQNYENMLRGHASSSLYPPSRRVQAKDDAMKEFEHCFKDIGPKKIYYYLPSYEILRPKNIINLDSMPENGRILEYNQRTGFPQKTFGLKEERYNDKNLPFFEGGCSPNCIASVLIDRNRNIKISPLGPEPNLSLIVFRSRKDLEDFTNVNGLCYGERQTLEKYERELKYHQSRYEALLK